MKREDGCTRFLTICQLTAVTDGCQRLLADPPHYTDSGFRQRRVRSAGWFARFVEISRESRQRPLEALQGNQKSLT